jgi:hypothetical protein
MKNRVVIGVKGDECVETVAKRKYWSMVDEYMRSGAEDVRMEGAIELLRRFLEEKDLSRFRCEMEDYIEKGLVPYLLLEMDDGGIHAEIKTE